MIRRLIILLLIVGCDDYSTGPERSGCLNPSACNYDSKAIFQDVNDICIFEDCAGECGGVDTSCFGCDDVKNSGLVVDEPYDGSEGAWIGGCDCFEQIED